MKIDTIENKQHTKIEQAEWFDINGCRQYISIKGNDINNPFLLVLHGGPGDAALPLVQHYNKSLENHYNVVIWEQRGCGKSFYKFTKKTVITVDMFIEDMYAIVKMILTMFEQQKIFLMAHSWGSTLGLKFISEHSALVYAYIGCGQVVNMHKNMKASHAFTLEKTTDKKLKSKLECADWSCSTDHWFDDLILITKQVIKNKGSLYKSSNYNDFYRIFLKTPNYSIRDLLNRLRGATQSIKFLWKELMYFNMEDSVNFAIPVVFVEGRHDYHASSKIAHEYYEKIQSEKKIIWFEESAHFPQWEEANRFNELMIQLKKYKRE